MKSALTALLSPQNTVPGSASAASSPPPVYRRSANPPRPRMAAQDDGQDTQTALKESMALVLGAKDGKTLSGGDLTPLMRINEQEMYAALVHDRLKTAAPGAAAIFAQRYADQLAQIAEKHGEPQAFKAADRLMRAMVRSQEVSHETYREVRDYAFGKAQFDSNRAWLGSERGEGQAEGDTPLRSVSTALEKSAANPAATAEEIAAFRAEEGRISAAKWKERKQAGKTAAAESAPAAGDPLPAGFIWKPVSESDGKLVVLLPQEYTGQVDSLKLILPGGKESGETGRCAGLFGDLREIYRFSRPGNAYPAGSTLVIGLSDGTQRRFVISNPGSRIG